MIFEETPTPTAAPGAPGATPNRDRPRAPITIEVAPEPNSDPRPAPEPPAAASPAPEVEAAGPASRRNLTPWLIAAVVILGAAAVAWSLLMNNHGDMTALGDRQAALEKRLAALESRPAPEPDKTALGGLAQRIDALEKKPAATPDALTTLERRVASAEAAAKQAQAAADAARGAVDNAVRSSGATTALPPAAPAVNLGPLNERIAALDARVAQLENALNAAKSTERVTEAKIEAGGASSERAGVAVVAQALMQAVQRGAPFADEVAALKALGVDAARLGPLQGAAAKGVPTIAKLRADFAAITAKLAAEPPPAAEGGLFDRLLAIAGRLVKIERVGEPGAPKVGLTHEVEAALARDDVAAGLEAWNALPQATRDASIAWRNDAQGRLAAETAARALLADSLKRLGDAKP